MWVSSLGDLAAVLDQTSEEELLHILKAQYPQEEEWLKKQATGFSLLDLKWVALEKGYQAAGFRLSLEQVKQLKAPVLVHLEPMATNILPC